MSKLERNNIIKSKQKTGKSRMVWGAIVVILGFLLVNLMPPPRYKEASHIIGYLFIPVTTIIVGVVLFYGGRSANRRALAEIRDGKVG
jgi:membrane protein DedA with SNARE-associated domain